MFEGWSTEKPAFGVAPPLPSEDQLTWMWMPIATIRMVSMQKYKTAWIRMAIPLVAMFPNSTTLAFPGIWNSNPGDNSINKITATTTGPQSADISLSGSLSLSPHKISNCVNQLVALQFEIIKDWWCSFLLSRKEWNFLAEKQMEDAKLGVRRH